MNQSGTAPIMLLRTHIESNNSALANKNENLGQLYFNHHFDQLSRRTSCYREP